MEKKYDVGLARFAQSLAANRAMQSICHVITDMRASSVAGMYEIYSSGRIFRLAMRGGAPPHPRPDDTLVVLLGEPLGNGLDELRDVLGKGSGLDGRTLIVHGTASAWKLVVGKDESARLVTLTGHTLGEGECLFWLGKALVRSPGRLLREGWYKGEVMKAYTYPDGVEGDLRGILHRLVTSADPYRALGVSPEQGPASLNAAFHRIVQAHLPERISPLETERRLDLHRRIREAALRAITLARAA